MPSSLIVEETKEPGTPFVSGGFNSPVMASPEARSDQSRGAAHRHSSVEIVEIGTAMASPEARSDQGRGVVQDRGVGSGIMLSPQRESSGQKADLTVLGAGVQGMQALAQSVIAGKTVYLQGAKITPAQVANFIDHKKKQLRSGVFLIEQLDADIDENAMNIIELKLVHSRAIQARPGPWRKNWDVEYFLKALAEIYAVSEVDKFAEAEGVWRALITDLQKTLRVDASDAGALSISFTAVLVETN